MQLMVVENVLVVLWINKFMKKTTKIIIGISIVTVLIFIWKMNPTNIVSGQVVKEEIDLTVVCAGWKPPVVTCEEVGGICVTNSLELIDEGVKLSLDGTIETTDDSGKKETYTKTELINLKRGVK